MSSSTLSVESTVVDSSSVVGVEDLEVRPEPPCDG